MNIQHAKFADIPAFVDLAEKAFLISSYAVFANFDPAETKRAAIAALTAQQTGNTVFLLAKENDKIEGCFIGSVSPLYGTDAMTATNLFFFVDPDGKKTTALRLIRSFMRWADQVNAPLLYRIGMSDAIGDLTKKDRAMRALGFRLAGGIYEMEK